jgi:hypothetical protein
MKTEAQVFIQKMMALLKLNEIRSIIKNGAFLISGGKCNGLGG